MSEVSYRAMGPVLDALAARGLPLQSVLDEIGVGRHVIDTSRGRFEWSAFTRASRKASELFGGCEGLEEAIYQNQLMSPSFGFMRPLAAALVRPRDLYWMGTRWFGDALFSVIQSRFEDLGPRSVRETLEIPPAFEDCPEFFYGMRGALRATPRLIGLGDAQVEMDLVPRRAVYTIDLPSHRRLFRWPFPRRSRAEIVRVVEEMSAVQDELRASHESLKKSNEELESRVRERTQQLLTSRAHLEEAQRLASLGTLAAGIAHEINNPLAAIQATAQLAQRIGDESRGRESLEKIIQESQRCSRIVRGLLQFARNEPTEKWSIDIREIAERASVLVRRYADERGVELRLDLSPEPLQVLANPLQLEQVLVILLRNAIEARDPHHAHSVTLHTAAHGGWARIEVHDTGRGIAEADLGRIFDPFFTTRLHDGGTGLGLSMAHGIVEEHGGRIVAGGALGVETCMQVEFRLHSS